jgi:hypothetical protein
VVSHKTRHAPYDPTRTDLRAAALTWMRQKGLLRSGQGGIAPEHVFFEETRAAKIARITALRCSHFVDDLAEVFLEPAFPREVTARDWQEAATPTSEIASRAGRPNSP